MNKLIDSNNSENLGNGKIFKKCPCSSGALKLIRKTDRSAFAEVQDERTKTPRMNCGCKKSKSLSYRRSSTDDDENKKKLEMKYLKPIPAPRTKISKTECGKEHIRTLLPQIKPLLRPSAFLPPSRHKSESCATELKTQSSFNVPLAESTRYSAGQNSSASFKTCESRETPLQCYQTASSKTQKNMSCKQFNNIGVKAESLFVPKRITSFKNSTTVYPRTETTSSGYSSSCSCSLSSIKNISSTSSAIQSPEFALQAKKSKLGYSMCETIITTNEETNVNKPIISKLFLTVDEDLEQLITPKGSKIFSSTLKGKLDVIRKTPNSSAVDESLVDAASYSFNESKIVKNLMPERALNNFSSNRSKFLSKINDSQEVNSIKPARKSTISRRSSKKNADLPFPLLYSSDYIQDILAYNYHHKNRFIVKPSYISGFVNLKARTRILNWLLKVSHDRKHPESAYYMAVRLFDVSIISLNLRRSHYQLAAIVSLWICGKFLSDMPMLHVSKIFSLCEEKYSKCEILTFERNVLKCTNFSLTIVDPSDFVHYYLHSANLDNNRRLKNGAHFMLECCSLFDVYSITETPFLSAAVTYMAYQILENHKEVPINFIWYTKESIEKFIKNSLNSILIQTIANKMEPFNKYSSTEKLHVADAFYSVLT